MSPIVYIAAPVHTHAVMARTRAYAATHGFESDGAFSAPIDPGTALYEGDPVNPPIEDPVNRGENADLWGRSTLEYRHVWAFVATVLRVRPLRAFARTTPGASMGDALANAIRYVQRSKRAMSVRLTKPRRALARINRSREKGEFNRPAIALFLIVIFIIALLGVAWWRTTVRASVARTRRGVDESTAHLSASLTPTNKDGTSDDSIVASTSPLAHAGFHHSALPTVPPGLYDTSLRPMSPRMRVPCMRIHGGDLASARSELRTAHAACGLYTGPGGARACMHAWIAGRSGDGPQTMRRLLALHEIADNVTQDFAAMHGSSSLSPSAGYAIPGKSFERDECLMVVRTSVDSHAHALLPDRTMDADIGKRASATTLFLVNPLSVPDDESGEWCSRDIVEVSEVTHLYPHDGPRKRTRPLWIRIDALLFDPFATNKDDLFSVHTFNFSGHESGAVHWGALLNAGHPE